MSAQNKQDNFEQPIYVKHVDCWTFKTYVTDSGKNALVTFYAPWSSVCEFMAPAYEELAKKMAEEDVNIVKMNANAQTAFFV